MKKLLFLISLLIIANPVLAECSSSKDSKCIDLMSSMYDRRATLFNVLNLSADQQKCKDTMDMNYLKEVGDKFEKYEQEKFVYNNMQKHNASKRALRKQEKVVKNLQKDLESLNGIISGEHGIGLEKREHIGKVVNSLALDYMRQIKKIFDPNNIFNPNKIF